MYTISVETHFRASHQLAMPDGSKEPVHHHYWSVTADVSSDGLNNMGVVIDFHKLRAILDNAIAELNNTALDRVEYFRQNNPTAENVAKYVYEKLHAKLPKGVTLQSIRVVEEPGCSAKFGGTE
jgi:6-pyruvoyltetrahydropterin/6-carboxytetrahydropterin synthase